LYVCIFWSVFSVFRNFLQIWIDSSSALHQLFISSSWDTGYLPDVWVVEVGLCAPESATVRRDIDQARWDFKNSYAGAHPLAFAKLAEYHGYRMVTCIEANDCFFVLEERVNFKGEGEKGEGGDKSSGENKLSSRENKSSESNKLTNLLSAEEIVKGIWETQPMMKQRCKDRKDEGLKEGQRFVTVDETLLKTPMGEYKD
jgi:hypothetical protein